MEANVCTWNKTGLSKEQTNLHNPEDFLWVKRDDKSYPLVEEGKHPIIDPRFKIRQTIYFMKENKITSAVVFNSTINLGVNSCGSIPKGWYEISVFYNNSTREGSTAYASKEELLNSL